MVGDRDVEGAGVLERGAHQMAGGDRPAVVGDRHSARAHHPPHLGKFLASLSHRHRADGIHAGEPGPHRLAHDEPHGRLIVGDGIGVRHRADGREPAARRGACAGRDRLLVLVPRLAQVHVHVHEPGRDDPARDVAHLHPIRRAKAGPHGGDLAVLDENVGGLVETAARVDHPAAAQQQRPHQSGAPRLAASASSGFPPASR